MDTEAFRYCRLKLGRAAEHRNAISALVDTAFAADVDRPVLRLRKVDDSDVIVAYVGRMPEADATLDRANLILGDALHNLRSALDHLAFQLAETGSHGRPRSESIVQFPIAECPREFENQARHRLYELRPTDRALIESFQPYRPFQSEVQHSWQLGGNFHPLRMLRELSNRDKHRRSLMLTTAWSALEVDIENVAFMDILRASLEQDQLSSTKPIALGVEIARARVPGFNTAMGDTATLLVAVALEDGRPVLPVLGRLEAAVALIIRAFDGA